jgi:hypothetical protein
MAVRSATCLRDEMETTNEKRDCTTEKNRQITSVERTVRNTTEIAPWPAGEGTHGLNDKHHVQL